MNKEQNMNIEQERSEFDKPEVVGFATHHDEPMLFPSRSEAAMYCDDEEEPVALIRLSDYEALQVECEKLLRKDAPAQAAPQPAAQKGEWDIDAAVEKAWGRFQAALEQDEPLPPPSIHAAAHYGTWLGREAHRHDEPRAGAFRNAARMLAVLESEVRRLHEELLAAQAQEAAPRDSLHDCALRAALEEAEAALEVATSRLAARSANYPAHVTSEARALEIVRHALGKSHADHFRDATKMPATQHD